MMRDLLGRLRREAWDAVELFLLPGLVTILPWSLSFRVFRLAVRCERLYRERWLPGLEQAQAAGFVDDPVTWTRLSRLTALVDHADMYLALTRTDRWMARHMTIEGTWPAADRAHLLVTFHWGAGMWALRSATHAGLSVSALAGHFDPAHFRGQRVRLWYTRLRLATIHRALGHKLIDIDTELRRALNVVKAGETLLALVDVPPDVVNSGTRVRVIDRDMTLPLGVFRLGASRSIPVTFYLNGFDPRTGRRFLRIFPPLEGRDAESLAQESARLLDAAIREIPAEWHFWGILPRFIAPREDRA